MSKKQVGDDLYKSSAVLHKELNKERERQGLHKVPAVNPVFSGQMSTGEYARRDKTFSNAFDFFIKLICHEKKKKEKNESGEKDK